MRDSVVLYRSFARALSKLSPEVHKECVTAIFDYALDDKEPDGLSDVAEAVFELMKPQIDANNLRYENGKKGGRYGALGGRPRNPTETPNKPQSNPKQTPNKPQINPKQTPNKPQSNPTETPNVKCKMLNDKCLSKERVVERKAPSRFSPPTLEEVEAYCAERKNGIDAQRFVDYYAARGWQLKGGTAMKDWRAAVRTWENREPKAKTEPNADAMQKLVTEFMEE